MISKKLKRFKIFVAIKRVNHVNESKLELVEKDDE